MEYFFDALTPNQFQRLINALLIKIYGDSYSITPLTGSDGGKDGEIKYYDLKSEISNKEQRIGIPSLTGRTIIQVKHHKIDGIGINNARNSVLSDFRKELKENIIEKGLIGSIDRFILISNPSSTRGMIHKVMEISEELVGHKLESTVWWSDRIIALLDSSPDIWMSFPQLFPGNKIPFLGTFIKSPDKIQRPLKTALMADIKRDSQIKFRQISLENDLFSLYTDCSFPNIFFEDAYLSKEIDFDPFEYQSSRLAAYYLIHHNEAKFSKIVIEGGPGQGRSLES